MVGLADTLEQLPLWLPSMGPNSRQQLQAAMILGIGVDLVDVPRMERALTSSWAGRFITRVFAPEEIAACERAPRPGESFAARFAAKEALTKALGTGFSRGVAPRMIVVRGGERTRPSIELRCKALELARSMKVTAIHVSLSHIQQIACAYVVVETNGDSSSYDAKP
jgi:holo-[acyl-carrier protein] synthase